MAQKTRRAVSKRFKVTGGGKIVRRSANRRHLMRNKTVKQKRRSGQDKVMPKGHANQVRSAMPHDC